MGETWKNLNEDNSGAHYSIFALAPEESGMLALRGFFPEAQANALNFVLFSTSGVHATYNTIEDAERFIAGQDDEDMSEVSFLVIQPRLVCMRYGICKPESEDDIAFLKKLRESSRSAIMGIGG